MSIIFLVALGIRHALPMRNIVICGLPLSTIFFHIIPYNVGFSKKKNIEHKMCVSSFSIIFVQNIFHSKNN